MENVASGVYHIDGYVNSFIVDGDQGVVLVDTGLPKKHGRILAKLEGIGRGPSDIVAILLTHSHADHVGGAAALKQTAQAPVIAPKLDVPAIEGEQATPPPPIVPGWLVWLTRLLPAPDPVSVDRAVAEGASGLPDDFRVVDTPGHTRGHASYLLDRDTGIAFVGDAAVARKDGRVGRGFFNGGRDAVLDASIAHLGEQTFDIAFFGHSGPIHSNASTAFQAFRPL